MTPATPHLLETDTEARKPLGMLIGSSLVWLVVASALALLTTIQLMSPGFLSGLEFVTHGRARALQETVFIYGFAANAAFAVATWVLGRLSGAPFRGLGLACVGTIFWNLAVTAGVICIAIGEMTSIPFLQMPRYLHPLLLVAYAAIATPGVLAWTGRRQRATYTAQWYAIAALFLFPWVYSAAQVMLLVVPMRGVAHSIAGAWFAQNIVTCFLVPAALAAAYYLVPKTTGRTVDHYDFAPHGFWTLVAIGSWTGARHLVGGPVPAWIPATAIVATQMLLFHYLIVALNLHFGMRGARDVAARFLSIGLVLYVIGGVADALFAYQSFAETLQYTYFTVAQLKLVLYGGFSLMMFAAIHYMAPRITGVAWGGAGVVPRNLALSAGGAVIAVVGFAIAGVRQGRALLDAGQTFTSVAASAKPGLTIAIVGEGLFLLGALVLLAAFCRMQKAARCACRTVPVSRLGVSTT